ncbi:MAG: helix-turn-helix domain-containing protein, partial [Peptococcaceae bacterium]|nr:helix-turn-helix domain-containing protein [Peptococcaceae bacterium]
FTVPEAARHLGLKKSKVYDMAKRGEIPTIRFGRYVRIPRQALEKWVDAQIRRKGGKLIVKERFIQPGI